MHGNQEKSHDYNVNVYEDLKKPYDSEIAYVEDEPDEEVNIKDYIEVILRKKWLVILVFTIIVVSVTIATLLAKPVYRAVVTIKISIERQNILTIQDVSTERMDFTYLETQYRIIKSPTIARKVIKKLNLQNSSEFLYHKGLLSTIKVSFLQLIFGKPKKADDKNQNSQKPNLSEEEISPFLIYNFLKRLKVEPDENSQLVYIIYEAFDPELCSRIVNTIAETYLEFNLESKLNQTLQARKWLEDQIERMQTKLEESEEKLVQFSSGFESIYFTNDEKSINPMVQNLTTLSNELSQTKIDRISKEVLYEEILKSGASHTIFLNNPVIEKLEQQYADLETQGGNFKQDYPTMIELNRQKNILSERIGQEKKKIIASIKAEFDELKKREEYLQEVFEEQKKKVLDLQKKSVEYQIIKREADTNKSLYDNLLQRLKEIGITASLTAANVMIIDKAGVPISPFKPNKTKNIIMAVFFGIVLGIGLAFTADFFDNTVKNIQYIESKVQLPSLGVIPFDRAFKSLDYSLIPTNNNNNNYQCCPISEAFRSLSTFIQLSSPLRPPKTLLVTSAMQDDGKSVTSTNVALSMAETLGKGILIDADLRKLKNYPIFKVDNAVGLSTYLTGNVEFGKELFKPTIAKNIHIITSGPIPPNPCELISSQRMQKLIQTLSSMYDFIVIDSPPVLGMADSIYLSRFVEGVLLVTRAGKTPKDALKEAKKLLKQAHAHIIGVVLNGVTQQDMPYRSYYYYSKYYSKQ